MAAISSSFPVYAFLIQLPLPVDKKESYIICLGMLVTPVQ